MSAVFAAYDLSAGKTVYYREMADAQVVMVEKGLDDGQNSGRNDGMVSVLVNPMGFQPLQLYELDEVTMETLRVMELELPHEYLSREDFYADTNLLFQADMNEDSVVLLLDDAFSISSLKDEERFSILAVYDRKTGAMTWRARLVMDVGYEVDDVKIGADD